MKTRTVVLDEYGIDGEWRPMTVDGLQVALRAGHQPVSPVLLRNPARGRPCRVLRPDPWGEELITKTARSSERSRHPIPQASRAGPNAPRRSSVRRSRRPTARRGAGIAGARTGRPRGVSVEHFTNFHLGNLPAFAIATGDSYLGPVTAEMGRFINVAQHQYPGDASLGRHLYEFALDSEFDPPWSRADWTSTRTSASLSTSRPGREVPAGSRHRERRQPAVADAQALLRLRPDDPTTASPRRPNPQRVVVLGTGGLSHWVGLPESGQSTTSSTTTSSPG